MHKLFTQKLSIIVACFIVASCSTSATRELALGTPESVGMSSERLSKLDDVIQEYLADGRVQGVVVGVTRRNKVVYYKAHGITNPVTKTPLPKDTFFAMASSTKPILGVAAMMLIEEGLISPDDPVEKYITEFKGIQVAVPTSSGSKNASYKKKKKNKNKGKNKGKGKGRYEKPADYKLVDVNRPLTIGDLLTHTAGLETGGLGSAVADLRRGPEETLATFAPRVAKGPLDFQPGTRWAYSGTVGLDIVARIIEIASGTPFNEFVRTRIFEPLDMKDTYWNLPRDKLDRLPVHPNSKGRFIESPYYYSGSLGLLSTARDYMHFEQMLLNKGTLFGHQLLKPKSIEMMSTNKVGSLFGAGKGGSGMGFGYTVGVTLDPEKSRDPRPVGTFGWGGAAGTISWTAPAEDLTFVYMVRGPTDLPRKLTKIVIDAINSRSGM